MVEFRLDEDQRQIQDMMRKFAAEELRKASRECDEKAELPEGMMEKIWELGICANTVPESYGGYEMARSVVTGAIMAEEFAWGDLGLALGALSPLLGMVPVQECGSDAQKEKWLPKFCGEKPFIATAALTEPRITFDPVNLFTTVDIENDKMILNGKKCMVPVADNAEMMIVYATTSKGSGPASVEAIIVEKGAKGMKISERKFYQGLRPLPLFDVTFKDCEIPLENRVGENAGIDFMRLLNISRAIQCAMAVGVSRASNEYAIDYAKERYAFGEPIASRQAIAWMLAESAMEVDAMRLLAWRAAWRLDKGQDATRDATLAKNYCAEQTMKIVDYGVQVLGGHGYIREHPIELWFRNGRAFSSIEGMAIV